LSADTNSTDTTFKPGWIAIVVFYLVFAAVVARTLAVDELRPILAQLLEVELVYFILFTSSCGNPGSRLGTPPHFVVQSALVLWMLSFHPDFDFIVNLFMLLTIQVSLYFRGRMRWIWVGALIFLTGGSLIYYLGLLEGLAKSLTTIAAEIIIPAYFTAAQEIKSSQRKSQELLSELQDTNQQLQQYADQVEELASIQERNRLARDLHDTVSQLIFSISLTTRSAQLLMEKDPARVPEVLKRQEMTRMH
jgi:signal transduction histidine kinase